MNAALNPVTSMINREARVSPGAIVLALLVHLALLLFFVVGINWQSHESNAVEAEAGLDLTTREAAPLPVPQVAPEPEPEPEPAPVARTPEPVAKPAEDPEIALQQQKKRIQEEKKREEEKLRIAEKSVGLN
jgi:colicin import membrane protein